MERLTEENFEKFLKKAKKPVLVDFFSLFCPPCKALFPILENLEKQLKDKVIFAYLNVDGAPKIVEKFQISQTPTIILFDKGKFKSGFIGFSSQKEIKNWLLKELGKDEERPFQKKD